eukprot:6033162-Pyramimonas_sp.AAC.1
MYNHSGSARSGGNDKKRLSCPPTSTFLLSFPSSFPTCPSCYLPPEGGWPGAGADSSVCSAAWASCFTLANQPALPMKFKTGSGTIGAP